MFVEQPKHEDNGDMLTLLYFFRKSNMNVKMVLVLLMPKDPKLIYVYMHHICLFIFFLENILIIFRNMFIFFCNMFIPNFFCCKKNLGQIFN